MNQEKFLVLIKGIDKTEEIIKYEREDSYKFKIYYKNSKQTYTYAQKDFQFYKEPENIEFSKYKILINDGYAYNVKKILKFEEYCKIFFEDNTITLVSTNQLKLVKNDDLKISINKFDYYKEISKIVSIVTDNGKMLLTDEYQKINYISDDTALYKYLNPNSKINNLNRNIDDIIFPFGANKSQFQAVKNAITNQISIIEGPPGTGKTQTILNIIANIIKNGQTVAVVSNNNEATKNVYEKLQKYNLDYLCAILGKKENKEEFIKNQTGKYPKFAEKIENEYSIKENLEKLNNSINRIFKIQNTMAKLKEELNEVGIQHEYFNKHHNNAKIITKVRNINRLNSETIMKLKVEYEELKDIKVLFKIKSQLFYGIGNKDFYRQDEKNILLAFNKLFFVVKEYELKKEIQECKKKLKLLGNSKLELLTNDSKILLNEYLRKRYKENVDRRIFEISDLYKNSIDFAQEYPIIFSTTYSIKKCLNPNYKFDYIIMDESSQVDLITGVLALSVARNAVIVGDLKQLPNVITTQNRKEIEELSKKYIIDSNYDYLKNSFLSSITQTLSNCPRVLLKEHYRCHPKIIQFCNKKFYDDQLIIMTEDHGEDDVLKVYKTTKGGHARGHINYREIDVIEKEIMQELTKNVDEKNIGIISPYRDQKYELKKKFEDNSKIDTIHKFQGREEDAIIITTVDNKIGEFVDNPNMLNVAVTRAKKYLRLIVSGNEDSTGNNIADLIKYIQYNNFEILESKTKSIYDLLYKENAKQRWNYLKNKKRISEYDSENLTYNLIRDFIKDNGYSNLDVVVRVPLSDVLADLDLLNSKEKKYASNDWTHIDFVIYNKMDKKIVIAIEVDGYSFHKEGTRQKERDILKDEILSKYDVPLLRFDTTGSGEKEILEKKIQECFLHVRL